MSREEAIEKAAAALVSEYACGGSMDEVWGHLDALRAALALPRQESAEGYSADAWLDILRSGQAVAISARPMPFATFGNARVRITAAPEGEEGGT